MREPDLSCSPLAADRLDELTIPAPQTGKPLQRLGVTTQLLLPDGHRPEARRAAIDVMLDADALASGAHEQWMGPEDDRPRRIRDDFPDEVRAGFEPLTEDPTRALSLALLQCEVPPRWQAEVTMPADEPRRPRLAHLAVSAPPSFALRDPGGYVRTVLTWASALCPQYGTAGFALVAEIGMAHQTRGTAWPWWQRYPGLDCAVFNFQPKPGRYVSVNWLTLVGDPVLETLGGLDTVRERLRGEAAERHIEPPAIFPYDGGALIRAATLPMLGDRARGDIPASYRAVNAALQTARFEDYPVGPNIHLIDAPRSMDLRQATLDWVRRFDD